IVFELYDINLDDMYFFLNYPPKSELGDSTFNCFELSKELKKNINEITEDIKNEFQKNPEYFEKISISGGYINFFLNKNVFIRGIESFNLNPKNPKNETIVVDYIGYNLGKPLHIGHICPPSQGQVTINVYKYLGYNVISDSHFGDWGLFGKLVAAYKLYGNKNDLQKDPIEHLLMLYIKFTNEAENDKDVEEIARNEFKKLSNGDEENIKLWKEFVSYSLSAMSKILELLNVKADYDIGESFYEGLNLPKLGDFPELKYTMNDIVKELVEKGIATKNDDGSVGVIFPEETKIPSCVLQKKDGTNLYLTSDLACIKYRITNGWNPSKIIYHVDNRQQLHLKQTFWIAKKVWPELKDIELYHALHGFITLKEGAMSTRKGIIIRLQDLIEEGFIGTKKILEEKGRDLKDEDIQAIAIGAIKYSYLSQDRERDVVFDWDKALSFEGNSGPYIQYAYVRSCHILKKAGEIFQFNTENLTNIILEYDINLIKKLFEFDKIVLQTALKYKPHILALYLFELSTELNSFYVHIPKIIEEENKDLKYFRLTLIEKLKETLEFGFKLLAINMPKEM
ncbi:arginine--tRNA ligase, partial [Candidatus Gracilibacteria bacterium]|nr:arginine--tRNA ligase [Candidatus Gracilibacteria bacterium]